MKKESQVIFDRNVVEFVTVAAEFCKFLEQAEGMKRATFVEATMAYNEGDIGLHSKIKIRKEYSSPAPSTKKPKVTH